ncbi:hypothetical protein G9A89_007069 [Geosiphon pyriformis]|nr:hypothetical protein G9A89_007069 [Geosiphon pyriformis]
MAFKHQGFDKEHEFQPENKLIAKFGQTGETPRTPRTPRLSSTPTHLRSGRSALTSTSTRTTPSPVSHGTSLLQLFKSTKKKNSKSIVRNDVLKLHIVEQDWICVAGKTPSKKKIKATCDRFIPNREAMNDSSTQFNIAHRDSSTDKYMDSRELAYQSELARACGIAIDKRILAFNVNPPINEKADFGQIYNRPSQSSTSIQINRRIIKVPERVLDAPGMRDDYYLNLLDWSCKNMVAIGLDKNVYIWNADTGQVTSIGDAGDNDYVASLSWSADGDHLAVGMSDGDTQVWDVSKEQKVRSMLGHSARVGVLSWKSCILSSGCKDGNIWNHDIRIPEHRAAQLSGHTSEVCGLKWRPDGFQLASGGNDNRVNIWDARSSLPKYTKEIHVAAVKALAWCPWQTNLLATGGGSYDRTIHFWNTTNGTRLQSTDTGSQVTSIIWSREYRELLSTHGFPDNHLALWAYPSLQKIADIKAHETRVLHSAISPDGQVVATAAGDENLKFWRAFESTGRSVDTFDGKDVLLSAIKSKLLVIKKECRTTLAPRVGTRPFCKSRFYIMEKPGPQVQRRSMSVSYGSSPLPTNSEEHAFSSHFEDYEIQSPIGYGSSAIVYNAIYIPSSKKVAIKIIDLDYFERNQIDELRRETQLMSLSKHANILGVHGSFVNDSKLYIVTPYMSAGSCLDIMKTAHPDGLEEVVIATILKQALQGLDYLHKQGYIHRQAANEH